MRGSFFEYVDDLLRLQAEAVKKHEHRGVLGNARENFLKQQLAACVEGLCMHTGEVYSNGKSHGQHDIIIRKPGTLNTELGGQIRIHVNDCAGIIEVKSIARGNDLQSLNQKSSEMKNTNPDLLVGLFCYKLGLQKKTVLSRFGYCFDRSNDAFVKNEKADVVYKHLDFVICLDNDEEDIYFKHFMIIHDRINDYFTLELVPPFSGMFFSTVSRIHNPQTQ